MMIVAACISCRPMDGSVQAEKEIIAADIAMSDMAAKEGFHAALLAYADDSLIKPAEGEFPVIGKTALQQYWAGKRDFKTLTWTPVRAEASQSGDLGFTFGNWKLQNSDTILYGNYYTFWKKQNDGNWKFVFDGGNGTPAEEKLSIKN